MMNVSNESREFLNNLRLYLVSSGKKDQEIEDIIEQLEDHLFEAERNAKSVEDIIGRTPKEYMEQIANEMSLDVKGLFQYVPVIIMGVFAYVLLGDAIRKELEYSLVDLIGYPVIILFSLMLTTSALKYSASNKITKIKERLMFMVVGLIPLVSFIALIYLNRYYDPPSIKLGVAGGYVAFVISILIFIGIAIWSRTWMTIIVPFVIFLPQFIINQTNLQESTKVILNAILVPISLAIYTFTVMRLQKRKRNC